MRPNNPPKIKVKVISGKNRVSEASKKNSIENCEY